MKSDKIRDPSDIQLLPQSLFIEALECSHPEKYTDNSEYDVFTGRISSIYTVRLAEDLSYEAATVLTITTKARYFKVDSKTLVQRWRIWLDPAKQTIKTKTKV